jgi:hypothetical protein
VYERQQSLVNTEQQNEIARCLPDGTLLETPQKGHLKWWSIFIVLKKYPFNFRQR